MQKTIFEITKMDCLAEENLIKMKLDGVPGIHTLFFDIPGRKLTVYHDGPLELIEKPLNDLNLGSKLFHTEQTEQLEQTEFLEQASQRTLLKAVLAINFAFFIIEMITGLISRSMGLVADSLDMLADAFVYGISLLAVGGTLARKKKIATLTGYFQITLAMVGFVEVLRRFIRVEKIPDFHTMIIVSILALAANATSLYLLQKSKSRDAHIRASTICTSNDVIVNFGVIIAGFLVHWLDSNKPDLIVGAIVFVLVMQGAIRILKLGK
ncbi:MAG TPA: cation transporter [Candidatus Kapabacteria bacterium]|nr:cation transporter [Candidatus Kapabacteria bacterium]